jgi:transposase
MVKVKRHFSVKKCNMIQQKGAEMTEQNKSVEATVRSIRRATRKKYTAEEKVRIVLEGLRGESTIAELCRKEGIQPNLYYKWSKEFLEAGKQRLIGDTQRQADSLEWWRCGVRSIN